MELTEMKAIWQTYETRLDKSIKLNLQCLQMIQAQKVRTKLAPLLWQRVAELVMLVLVIGWLVAFMYKNMNQFYYVLAACILVLFYVTAMVNCVRQIVTIKQLDFSDDLVTIQSSLVLLQTHIVNYVRLTFLVFPGWLAYPLVIMKAFTGFDVLLHLHGNWWTAQLIFSFVLVPLCFWIYHQVSYKNIHKRWVKFIIRQSSGTRVLKAMQLMQEMEAVRTEKTPG